MNDREDRELTEQIRRAFDAQEIPLRPESILPAVDRNPSSRAFTGFEVLVPMTVVLVVVLIAFATWPGDGREREDTKSSRRVDSKEGLAEAIEPFDDGTSQMIAESSLASPPNDSSSPSEEGVTVQSDETVRPETVRPGPLRKTVELINQCLVDRVPRPEPLGSALAPWFAKENHDDRHREDLSRALATVGIPEGVKSVKVATPDNAGWLQDPSRLTFRYRYEPKQLESDARNFFNALLGADIFDPVLDGIRDDADGPRVDLRKEFFPKLSGELLLTVDRGGTPGEERILCAIGITDESQARFVLERVVQAEPDAERHEVGEITVFDCGGTLALCVVDGYWLMSDPRLVFDALRRRSNGG